MNLKIEVYFHTITFSTLLPWRSQTYAVMSTNICRRFTTVLSRLKNPIFVHLKMDCLPKT